MQFPRARRITVFRALYINIYISFLSFFYLSLLCFFSFFNAYLNPYRRREGISAREFLNIIDRTNEISRSRRISGAIFEYCKNLTNKKRIKRPPPSDDIGFGYFFFICIRRFFFYSGRFRYKRRPTETYVIFHFYRIVTRL